MQKMYLQLVKLYAKDEERESENDKSSCAWSEDDESEEFDEGLKDSADDQQTLSNKINRKRKRPIGKDTRSARFQCQICDKIYTTNYNLRMHIQKHYGE